MSPLASAWIKVIHLFGLLLWTGGMLGCLHMLRAHSNSPNAAHDSFSQAERGLAVVMDIGATLAMISGFYMAFALVPSPFTNGGWLHAKLTLVILVVLGLHIFLRVKVRKFRQGHVRAVPGFALPLLVLALFGTLVLAAVKPF